MFLHDHARKYANARHNLARGGSVLASIISGIGNIVRRIPTQDLIHGTIGTAATLAGAYGIKKAVDAAKEKKEAEARAAAAAAQNAGKGMRSRRRY